MKQKEAVQAYMSAKKLNSQDTNAKTAIKVFNLCAKLEKAWAFQLQEESKLLERHPEIDPDTHGIKFKGEEEKKKAVSIVNEFNKEADEIGNLDFEIEFEPFTIKLDEEPGIKLSGSDIGALSPFISFE